MQTTDYDSVVGRFINARPQQELDIKDQDSINNGENTSKEFIGLDEISKPPASRVDPNLHNATPEGFNSRSMSNDRNDGTEKEATSARTIIFTDNVNQGNIFFEIGKLGKPTASERAQAVFLYSLFAPLTRTSISALYYPIVFPEHEPFYGIDIGLDVIGFGYMPDDGIVVWKYMNPDIPGSTSAPFQYVIYSQIGLPWTLAVCIFLGFIVGVSWRCVNLPISPKDLTTVAGVYLVVSSMYLAIDSPRNILLSSYGVVFAMIFLVLILLLQYFGIKAFRLMSAISGIKKHPI